MRGGPALPLAPWLLAIGRLGLGVCPCRLPFTLLAFPLPPTASPNQHPRSESTTDTLSNSTDSGVSGGSYTVTEDDGDDAETATGSPLLPSPWTQKRRHAATVHASEGSKRACVGEEPAAALVARPPPSYPPHHMNMGMVAHGPPPHFMHPSVGQMSGMPAHFMSYGAWQARRMVAMAHAMSTAMQVASAVQAHNAVHGCGASSVHAHPPVAPVHTAPPAPVARTEPAVDMSAALALLGMAAPGAQEG